MYFTEGNCQIRVDVPRASLEYNMHLNMCKLNHANAFRIIIIILYVNNVCRYTDWVYYNTILLQKFNEHRKKSSKNNQNAAPLFRYKNNIFNRKQIECQFPFAEKQLSDDPMCFKTFVFSPHSDYPYIHII